MYLTVRCGEAQAQTAAYGGGGGGGALRGPPTGCVWIAPSGSQRVPRAAEFPAGLMHQLHADPWAPSALCTHPGRVEVLDVLSRGRPQGTQVPGCPSASAFATKQRKNRRQGGGGVGNKTTKGTSSHPLTRDPRRQTGPTHLVQSSTPNPQLPV